MGYNKRYSIFQDFNTNDYYIWDDESDKKIMIYFDSEAEAIKYIKTNLI